MNDKPKYNDSQEAFKKAIKEGRLTVDKNDKRFAGDYMYMGNFSGRDQFKSILLRNYI